MTKKKAKTVEIPKDMFKALIICHGELVRAYSHFGGSDNYYKHSIGLKAMHQFEPTLDDYSERNLDEFFEKGIKPLKSKPKPKGPNRKDLIEKAEDRFYDINKRDPAVFSRLRFLKEGELQTRITSITTEVCALDNEVLLNDHFFKTGDEIDHAEVFMAFEEELNVEMTDDFVDMLYKIKDLELIELCSIIWRAAHR